MQSKRRERAIITFLKHGRSIFHRYIHIVNLAPNEPTQLILPIAVEALNSEELKNALEYGHIDPQTVLERVTESAEDLYNAALSSLGLLSGRRGANYHLLKEAILTALEEDSKSRGEDTTQQHTIFTGAKGVVTGLLETVNEPIGSFFGGLCPATANFVAIMLACLTSLVAIVGIAAWMLSGFVAAVFSLIFLGVAGQLVLHLGALQNGRLEVTTKESEDISRTTVSPFIREIINAALRQHNQSETFHVTTAPALSELSDPEQLVLTSSMARLRELTYAMTHGSVGIAGARGVGKTTLLRAFCESRLRKPESPELAIMVTAPVDYDGREFILQLFGYLCETVLALSGPPMASRRAVRAVMTIGSFIALATSLIIYGVNTSDLTGYSRIAYYERMILAGLSVIAIMGAGAFLAISLSYKDIDRTAVWKRFSRWVLITTVALSAYVIFFRIYRSHFGIDPHHVAAIIGRQRKYWAEIIAGVIGAALLISRPKLTAVRRAHQADHKFIAVHARENLRRIRFMQTRTLERSGVMNLPMSLQLGGRSVRELAERDMTLPQIVSDYRAFVVEVVTWWKAKHGGMGRLVIGIDEVDKIDDVQAAGRFLNEIKAIFGTPYCLYLVSISDDALRQFEKRSAGFRSTFDSIFDDVVYSEPISLSDARNILLRRIAGIGETFLSVCYVFSAGLPRDMLRIARAFVQARREGLATLQEILPVLVRREVSAAKRSMLQVQLETAQGDRKSSIRDVLFNEEWPGSSAAQLLASATHAMEEEMIELYVILIFLGTVMEFFAEAIGAVPPSVLFASDSYQEGITKLAIARGILYSDSHTALGLIHAARKSLGLYALRQQS